MEANLDTSMTAVSFSQEKKVWKSTFQLFLKLLRRLGLLEEIYITLKDHNTEFYVHVGENIKVVLPENRSVSYAWEIDGNMPLEIELLHNKYKSYHSNSIQNNGKRVFEFIAKETGVVDLNLRFDGNGKIIKRFQTKLFIQ